MGSTLVLAKHGLRIPVYKMGLWEQTQANEPKPVSWWSNDDPKAQGEEGCLRRNYRTFTDLHARPGILQRPSAFRRSSFTSFRSRVRTSMEGTVEPATAETPNSGHKARFVQRACFSGCVVPGLGTSRRANSRQRLRLEHTNSKVSWLRSGVAHEESFPVYETYARGLDYLHATTTNALD